MLQDLNHGALERRKNDLGCPSLKPRDSSPQMTPFDISERIFVFYPRPAEISTWLIFQCIIDPPEGQ